MANVVVVTEKFPADAGTADASFGTGKIQDIPSDSSNDGW